MRKLATYLLIALVLASSCDKKGGSISPSSGSLTGSPILFVQEIQTKAPLLLDMSGTVGDPTHFSVVGYQYSNYWATEHIQAKANVFTSLPLDVTCDQNGTCDYYSPKEIWDRSKNYTFFAYYPANLQLKTENGSSYGPGSEDVPYVQYNTPTLGGTLDPSTASMSDIVTASIFDTNNRLTNIVPLTFKHRLFCISVRLQNIEGNDPATASEYDNMTLKDLSLTLNNIKYSSALIPLDDSKEMKRTAFNPVNNTVTFKFVENDNMVIAGTEVVTLSYPDKYILLIPQEQSDTFGGKITMSYSYKNSLGGGAEELIEKNDKESDIEGAGTIEYRAGRKYNVSILFSKESISVIVNDAGQWDNLLINDGNRVEHDIIFE